MKRVFLLVVTCISACIAGMNQLTAQDYCSMPRFDQTAFDSAEIQVISDIVYGSGINRAGELETLHLDIYRPMPELDTLLKKPCVFFVHGGGLVGGSKSRTGAVTTGYLHAEAGFVYVSIDYRLGWDNGNDSTHCGGDTIDMFTAIYRAVQDTKAAYRFIKENADVYGIDTNYIIAEGNSAGSMLVLLALYGVQDDYYANFADELGYLDSADNSLFGHDFDPIATITEAAGLPDPNIVYRKDVPGFYFHGTCDPIVPYFSGPAYSCFDPYPYPTFYGSYPIVQLLKAVGRSYYFYTGEGAGHDVAIPDTIFSYAKGFIKDVFCDKLHSAEYYRITGKHICSIENGGALYLQNIYPNPVSDHLVLEVSSTVISDVHITVFNMNGQVVYDQIAGFYPPLRSYVLSTVTFPDGMYLVRIEQGKDVYVNKFVK